MDGDRLACRDDESQQARKALSQFSTGEETEFLLGSSCFIHRGERGIKERKKKKKKKESEGGVGEEGG